MDSACEIRSVEELWIPLEGVRGQVRKYVFRESGRLS
jgi:hypothetical protein